MNLTTNNIDHTAYPKMLKSKTSAQLRYTIQDCREALAAMPDNAKAGYYLDEICYCSQELKKR